jgi:branched-chain amino acid transport system substrate-binding protein
MRDHTAKAVAAVAISAAVVASSAALAEKIRIGATMRMISENGQKYGQMVKDEFDLINAAGGINGNQIELILLNDECKSDKGVANANKFIHQHKVHLIIGSTCSSVSLPIVDITAKEQVPQIIPHSTNHKITQKGSAWVFRVPISARFYKGVVAKYVAETIGTKVAYVYATDAAAVSDAEGMIDFMRKNYKAEPVLVVKVQEKEIDFRSHLLKIKSLKPEALFIAAQHEPMARALVQSYEVGIPPSVKRVANSVASNAPVPAMAGDAIKGVFYTAAFSPADDRPIARLFTRMMREKYDVHAPDHDFSQAWDLVQIVRIALERADLKLTDDALAADRTAIRDAIATVKDYQGLASGPISFCAEPTPQCRDGNRTPVLIAYKKGGEKFETEVLARVTMEADFGLE